LHYGKLADFEPVFTHLIEEAINDSYSNAYTNAILSIARRLTSEAEGKSKNLESPRKLYLNANTVFRSARFSYIGTPLKSTAFEEQKAVYLRGSILWDVPITESFIPHTHDPSGDGDSGPPPPSF
jgi:hypothetical protein